jgi:DNA-binding GntR family transcriptional regulator
LLAAIRLRDATEAARLMREHLDRLEAQLDFTPSNDQTPDLESLFAPVGAF